MHKHFRKLAGIYLFSLAISIFGFLVDSDENTNTILMSAFEITAMSFVIFATLSVVMFVLNLLYCSLASKFLKSKSVD